MSTERVPVEVRDELGVLRGTVELPADYSRHGNTWAFWLQTEPAGHWLDGTGTEARPGRVQMDLAMFCHSTWRRTWCLRAKADVVPLLGLIDGFKPNTSGTPPQQPAAR